MLSVPEQHQRKIALATLSMSEMGASLMGGPNHREAVRILRKLGMTDELIRYELRRARHSEEVIQSYMGGSNEQAQVSAD
jgi:hypothetical protein